MWSELLESWKLPVTSPQYVDELPSLLNLSSLGAAQLKLLDVVFWTTSRVLWKYRNKLSLNLIHMVKVSSFICSSFATSLA